MTKSLTTCLTLAVLMAAGACAPQTPGVDVTGTSGSTGDYVPSAGETVVTTLSVDGKPASQVTYTYIELEQGTMATKQSSPSDSLLLVPIKEEIVDAALASDFDRTTVVSEADLRDFMANTWDPLINGKEDPGVNGKEFVDFAGELAIPLPNVMAALNRNGLSLAEIDQVLRALGRFDVEHDNTAFNVFDDLLTDGKLTWKDLFADLERQKSDVMALFTRLTSTYRDIHAVRKAWLDSHRSLSDFLLTPPPSNPTLPASTPTAGTNAPATGGNTASTPPSVPVLDIAKFGWSIMKDNAILTSGANTSVLNEQVKNPLAYGQAKDFTTRTFTWEGQNLVKRRLFSVKFRLKGTYGATSNQVGGHYLPSIATEFTETSVVWLWKVNGSTEISNVSNRGTVESPNPQIDVATKLSAGILRQRFAQTFSVTLTGEQGVIRTSH